MARQKKRRQKWQKLKKRGISLKVDDGLYWKFLEWTSKFRVNTNHNKYYLYFI